MINAPEGERKGRGMKRRRDNKAKAPEMCFWRNTIRAPDMEEKEERKKNKQFIAFPMNKAYGSLI